MVVQQNSDQVVFPDSSKGFFKRVQVGKNEKEKFRDAAIDGLLLRSGVKLEKAALGADLLAGYSLVELARESLRLAGEPYGGHTIQMVGRAMVSDDFQHIMANVANKHLFEGWETSGETWPVWCGEGVATDFRENKIVSGSEADDLDEIPEHGKYKYGELSDESETYQLVTYGKLFSLTRQAIINDDAGAITDIPKKHGEAAARKIGDIAYAVLTGNSAMGDGIALFHADHGNLGSGGVVSEVTIGEAEKLMGLQKDIADKRRLNIRPQFFIGPVSIKTSSEIFFQTLQYAGDNKAATRKNIYAGNIFTRVYDARLDDDSVTTWYMTGPKGKTVKVYFLNGVKKPYLETKQGWSTDGVDFKVRIDAAAKAVNYRAVVKNLGA